MKRHNGEDGWITFLFENPEQNKSLSTDIYFSKAGDFERFDGSALKKMETIYLGPSETTHICIVPKFDGKTPSAKFTHQVLECEITDLTPTEPIPPDAEETKEEQAHAPVAEETKEEQADQQQTQAEPTELIEKAKLNGEAIRAVNPIDGVELP